VELSRVTDYGVRAVMYLSVAKGLSRIRRVRGDARTEGVSQQGAPGACRRDIVRLKPGVKGGVFWYPTRRLDAP
jgi:hypothetical protein